MANKYLEKSSALLESALVAHLGQNLATRAAMRSPSIARSLANAFAHGYHGKVETGAANALKHLGLGVAAPDVEVMHKTFHALGHDLSPHIKQLSRKEQLGLRMVSEGRFKDLMHHGLHRSEKLQHIVDKVGERTGMDVPRLKDLTERKAQELGDVWTSKKHPLLSNFATRMSRGKVSSKAIDGEYSMRTPLLGSTLSIAADPASGMISTAKNLAASDPVRNNRTAKKAIDYAEKKFVKDPIKHGLSAGGTDFSRGLKNKAMEIGVSPTSMSLKNTSSAISGISHPKASKLLERKLG